MSDKLLITEPNAGSEYAMRIATSHEDDADSRGFVTEFLESAKFSGIQTPAQGLTQILDRVCGTDLMPTVTFMNAPKEAASSTDWHAQQIGGAVGIAGDFFLVNRLLKGFKNVFMAPAKAEAVSAISFTQSVARTARTGGFYQAIFTPSSNNESLVLGRSKNYMEGFATFGSMAASARTLHDFGLVKNRLGIGVMAGVPAGVVSAQTHSLLNGKGFASVDESVKSAYTFAMTGGVLTAAHLIPLPERGLVKADKGKDVSPSAVTGAIDPSVFKIANEASRQALEAFRTGKTTTAWADVLNAGDVKRTLFVQHEGTPHKLATRADFIAMCNLPEVSPLAKRLALPGATERPIFMDMPARDLVRFAAEKLSLGAVTLKTALSPELAKILEHNLKAMHMEPSQAVKMQEALAKNQVELTTMDGEFLRSHGVYSREANQTRPQTMRELGNATKYDPMKATQPVIVVQFDTPGRPQYHVINGNNRVYLFGSDVLNPQNRALPVLLFKSPETLLDILNVDPYVGFPKARRFNFY